MVAVDVGSVEEIYAFIETDTQSIERVDVLDGSPGGANRPGAEPDLRNRPTCSSELSLAQCFFLPNATPERRRLLCNHNRAKLSYHLMTQQLRRMARVVPFQRRTQARLPAMRQRRTYRRFESVDRCLKSRSSICQRPFLAKLMPSTGDRFLALTARSLDQPSRAVEGRRPPSKSS
jgi:hypothetical protein